MEQIRCPECQGFKMTSAMSDKPLVRGLEIMTVTGLTLMFFGFFFAPFAMLGAPILIVGGVGSMIAYVIEPTHRYKCKGCGFVFSKESGKPAEKSAKQPHPKGCFVLAVLAIMIFVVSAIVTAREDEEKPVVSRCTEVQADVAETIAAWLKDGEGASLRNLRAVRSKDFDRIYFVSGDLEGPGLEGDTQIATFAMNRLEALGSTVSVNLLAAEFSILPLGSETETDFKITMENDGAGESQACVNASFDNE